MVLSKRSLVVGVAALIGAGVLTTGAGLHLSKSWALFKPSPKETVDEVFGSISRLAAFLQAHDPVTAI